MVSSGYSFFTDTNLLVAQAPAGAYGPIAKVNSTDPDEYRVTSLHTATANPTAYAACDAILCVQRIPSTSLVNIILKPLVQPALNFAPVKYIIYKGILANSLIDTNGTDVAPLGNNDLTKFLWAEQAKKNASVTPATTVTAPAKALGIDLTGTNFASADPIDNLFYRAGVAFQLPVVKGGWSLGQFDKTSFGIEVLMEGLNFNHSLLLARQLENKISVPALAGSANAAQKFDHWHDKEQVLGFMDPCAFYGSFFRAGVEAKTSGSSSFASKAGNALYQDVLFSFANRNTAYLDIRNEHNFYFNYFGNYNDNIQVGNPLTLVDYYQSGWPILTLTASNFAPNNTTKARNAFQLRLEEGDNLKPLIYVSQGYRELRTKGKKFPEELTNTERFFDAFLPFGSGHTTPKSPSGPESLTFVVPNVTGQGATLPVSCYIRLKYLKQRQGTTAGSSVIQSANYLDNLIYPLDLRILPQSNASIKTSVFEEEVYVNAQDVAGLQCDFIAKVGIARDAANTSFWVIPASVRMNEAQASTLVTFSGETSESPESYPNVIASKYPLEKVVKSDLVLAGGTVPIAEFVSEADAAASGKFSGADFRKLLVFMVANTTYDSWKSNIAAATAALDKRFRTYLGVKNLQAQTDTVGVPYTSFELVLRGFALDPTAGNYTVQEMNTDSGGNITVYAPSLDEGPCSITSDAGTEIPCVPVNGDIYLKAETSASSGTYNWSTTSTKIALINDTAQTVTVRAKKKASMSRGAEMVQLVFTPAGGAALAPVTRKLTVIKVKFSESSAQSYGYDDMDHLPGDNHISVKQLGQTQVHVAIQGGGTADDLEFTSSAPYSVKPVTPAVGSGTWFHLILEGQDEVKNQATISAKCKGGPVCATIEAHVYKEVLLTATVAKIFDSTVPSATLARPTFDVTAAATLINTVYKSAVASLTLTDASPTCDAIDVRYDLDGDGYLTCEAGGIGPEIDAINAAFAVAGQRVVIVKKLRYFFLLETPAALGDSTITLKASYGGNLNNIELNEDYPLGLGATAETVKFTARAANVFTLATPLTLNHPVTEGIIRSIAGLSGNPILLQEQDFQQAHAADDQSWVIGHEIGHSLLLFKDLDDATNLMNHHVGWTDHKLRYRDIARHYTPPGGIESQWSLVAR